MELLPVRWSKQTKIDRESSEATGSANLPNNKKEESDQLHWW